MPFVRNDLALQSASSLSHTVLPRSVEHSGSPLLHFKYIWGLDSPKVTLFDDIAAMIRYLMSGRLLGPEYTHQSYTGIFALSLTIMQCSRIAREF